MVADALITFVCIDLKTQKALPLEGELREKLELMIALRDVQDMTVAVDTYRSTATPSGSPYFSPVFFCIAAITPALSAR